MDRTMKMKMKMNTLKMKMNTYAIEDEDVGKILIFDVKMRERLEFERFLGFALWRNSSLFLGYFCVL
jgi:hypothetical protein